MIIFSRNIVAILPHSPYIQTEPTILATDPAIINPNV